MQINAAQPIPTLTPAQASRLPATDRLLPRIDPALAAAMPRELMETRVGKGTVASELERSIRVRFDGTGPASSRTLVAETKGAVDLLASPAGSLFEKAVRSIASVADGYEGRENLRSIAFYPDEHSSKAGTLFDYVDSEFRAGTSPKQMIEPSPKVVDFIRNQVPDISKRDAAELGRKLIARDLTLDVAKEELDGMRGMLARNLDGHVAIAPSSSRELFATLGLYQPKADDSMLINGEDQIEPQLREAWRTVVHEVHHSVTPLADKYNTDEPSRVIEESIPTILETMQGSKIARKAGADINGAAANLATQGVSAAKEGAATIDWKPWNRSHLPKPPQGHAEEVTRRYVDGPQMIRDVIKLTGVDRRTREGSAKAEALLQDAPANELPLELAKALQTSHGLDAAATKTVAELIRKASVGDASFADIRAVVEQSGTRA